MDFNRNSISTYARSKTMGILRNFCGNVRLMSKSEKNILDQRLNEMTGDVCRSQMRLRFNIFPRIRYNSHTFSLINYE